MEPSFERPKYNPFLKNTDKTEQPSEPQKKKEGKNNTDKDRKDKHPQSHLDEKNDRKKDRRTDDDVEKDKKPVPKPEKSSDKDTEALEAKEQKRQQLIERSLHYKKLYEEAPVPRNPWVIARLMVAQHILAIQSQIEQPPMDAGPADELRLLASLDYMGIIADTLENPDIETSPEIKETCETLLHLAEETLQEGDEEIADKVVQAGAISAEKLTSSTETLDKTEEDPSSDTLSAPLPTSGAALIAVLHHIRQQSPQRPTVSPVDSDSTKPATVPIYTGGDTGGNSLPFSSVRSQSTTPSVSSSPPTYRTAPLVPPERHIAPEIPVRRSGASRQPEFHPTPPVQSVESLASLAVAAAFTTTANKDVPTIKTNQHEHQPRPASHPPKNTFERSVVVSSPSYTKNLYEASRIGSAAIQTHRYSPEKISSISPQPAHYPEAISTPEITQKDSSISSKHKIEHLSLNSLLTMAETVSIGHGQRLRSAYEKGVIDKDGLVKVLKSHAKHHDFLQEYRQQVTRRRNLVQSSPEFLSTAQTNPSNSPADTVDSKTLEQFNPTVIDALPKHFDTGEDFKPTADLPRPENQRDTNDPFYIPDEKIFHPTWLVPVLIALLILAASILLAFLILR